jgi:prophage regulatory protein
MTADASPLRLLRLPEVKSRCGLGRSAIYQGMKDGTFPQACRLGSRCVAWPSDAIDRWIRERIASRPIELAAATTAKVQL